jgi:hypothetical protein
MKCKKEVGCDGRTQTRESFPGEAPEQRGAHAGRKPAEAKNRSIKREVSREMMHVTRQIERKFTCCHDSPRVGS